MAVANLTFIFVLMWAIEVVFLLFMIAMYFEMKHRVSGLYEKVGSLYDKIDDTNKVFTKIHEKISPNDEKVLNEPPDSK